MPKDGSQYLGRFLASRRRRSDYLFPWTMLCLFFVDICVYIVGLTATCMLFDLILLTDT